MDNNYNYNNNRQPVDTSSYGAGFALGFLVGWIGLIIAYAIGGDNLKKGAAHGFLLEIILSLVFGAIYFLFLMSAGSSYYY